MIFEGIFRRFIPLKNGRGNIDARMTHLESIAVAQVESDCLEMTRAGRRFSAISGSTGVAPVQAVPTTAAAWVLYNGDKTRSYVMDDISTWLLSGTATAGLTILAVIAPLNAVVAAATGSTISSRSASNMTSKAVFGTGYTLSALSGTTQWFVVGSSVGGVPGVGGGLTQDLHGKIIVPPGFVLGLTVLAGAGTTPLYIMGATWHEVELDLE